MRKTTGLIALPFIGSLLVLGAFIRIPQVSAADTNTCKIELREESPTCSRFLLSAKLPATESYAQFPTNVFSLELPFLPKTLGSKSKDSQPDYGKRGFIHQVLDSYIGGTVGFGVGFLTGGFMSGVLFYRDTEYVETLGLFAVSAIVGGALGDILGSSTLLYYKNHRRVSWFNLFLGAAAPVVIGTGLGIAT
ncbi:MAG: hypothetical protein KAR36_07190, partial [Candidatus Latescibacteria bacterium]|nr:hypothetical protein [Candidatus Latescibacterota bacterium]